MGLSSGDSLWPRANGSASGVGSIENAGMREFWDRAALWKAGRKGGVL